MPYHCAACSWSCQCCTMSLRPRLPTCTQAAQLAAPPLPRRLSILQDTQAKVLARVTQLQQLDCLIQELLQDMPPGTSLQDLARPLGTAGGMTAAATVPVAGPGAAAAAKPPAGLK